MSRLLPVLILTWSAAAALPHDVTYRTTPDIEPTFIQAMSVWNKALDGYFTSLTPKDNGPMVTLEYGLIENSSVVATTLNSPIIVTFSDRYPKEWLPAACLHEVGHVLGLAHLTNPSSVMYPFLEMSKVELSEDDIVAVRTLYGLPVDFLLVATPTHRYSLACTLRVISSPTVVVESWDFGDGTRLERLKGVSQAPRHKFPARGTYMVMARLTNGLTAKAEVVVGRPIRRQAGRPWAPSATSP